MKEINMNGITETLRTQQQGGVVIGRLTKKSEMINVRGDVIDPVTKKIIKSAFEEKMPNQNE
jgi:hypothetical protein